MEKLIIKRVYNKTKKELFEAWTNPEIIQKWFFANENWSCEATNSFKIGGHYSIKMKTDEGNIHEHLGIYKEIVPHDKLVFTWESPMAPGTIVELIFKETKEGTELTLTHDLFANEEAKGLHQNGWTACITNYERVFID